MRTPIATLTLWLALSATAGLAQEPTGSLQANPFTRPDYMVSLPATAGPVITNEPVALELRTTLVANGTSLANINGTILSAGQTIEGHRLLFISEGRVVLSHSGERVVLDVYEQQLGSDEEDE